MENLKHGSRKLNVKVNGLVNIYGMKFHDIEGGFGEGKKSMLVKDIADIHNRPFGKINELINNNRNRFNDLIDIIDLKANPFEGLGYLELGFSKQAFNQSNNIYLLSERGYSKLLKILEDDFAWEQYDKLVDGYFQMREHFNSGQAIKNPYGHLSKEVQAIFALDHKQQQLEVEVKELKDGMPLFNVECKELQALVRKKGIEVLGGKGSQAYKNNSLRGKVYADIQHELKREFQVTRYEAIKRCQLIKAREIIADYKVPFMLKDEIIRVNNQINFKDVV